jgi:hypothetical protein
MQNRCYVCKINTLNVVENNHFRNFYDDYESDDDDHENRSGVATVAIASAYDYDSDIIDTNKHKNVYLHNTKSYGVNDDYETIHDIEIGYNYDDEGDDDDYDHDHDNLSVNMDVESLNNESYKRIFYDKRTAFVSLYKKYIYYINIIILAVCSSLVSMFIIYNVKNIRRPLYNQRVLNTTYVNNVDYISKLHFTSHKKHKFLRTLLFNTTIIFEPSKIPPIDTMNGVVNIPNDDNHDIILGYTVMCESTASLRETSSTVYQCSNFIIDVGDVDSGSITQIQTTKKCTFEKNNMNINIHIHRKEWNMYFSSTNGNTIKKCIIILNKWCTK